MKADGQISTVLPEIIQRNLIERVVDLISRDNSSFSGLEKDDADGAKLSAVARVLEMRNWVPLAGQYILNGRQIFDIHDGLTEMLLHTDLGDCTLSGLRLPYDCFYIHFGKQDEIKVPWDDDFEYVDGAFVAVTPWDPSDTSEEAQKRYKVGLSTVKKDGSGVAMPGYFIDFTPAEAGIPIEAAIETAIKRRKEHFFEGAVEGSVNYALAQSRAHHLDEGYELAKKALRLIFNSLFYLESLGTLPDETVGRDVSAQLTAEWLAAKPDRRFKVKQKLNAQGYTVVKLVGTELTEAYPSRGTREGVSTHWRRGFFREQAHGPKLTLRKRIWVKPVVVNPGKGAVTEVPGHVYVAPGPGLQ